MSYIFIEKAGAFKSNESMIFARNDGVMYFTARVPLIAELSLGGLLFPNLKLEEGEQLSYKEGSSSISIKSPVIGRYPRIVEGGVAVAAGTPLIRYQHYYENEKFAVTANFAYKAGRLKGVSFEIYKNDGLLKPGLMSKSLSLKANKKSTLMKLLKKSRKDGATAISISSKGVETHTPNHGRSVLLSEHNLLETWCHVEGTKRKGEDWALRSLGITL